MWLAEALVLLFEIYLAAGILFAVAFVAKGLSKVDSQAEGSSLGFRLLILPGAAALWPLLARRWMRGVEDPPRERNPHRDAVKGGA